ncbi:MAG: amino acid adenylation domain-containing protein [Moorea sp. SIO2I5]|nr:amino acid adenylation domain-containing protein [Moorena sp. SIO2I5]
MELTNFKDIYELSPMQQGMLFYTLCAPESGVYLQQFSWTLPGDIDTFKLKNAWQQVIDRHPILRTAFYWKNLEQPYQVVYEQAQLPWEERDWRQLSPTSQQEHLETFLKVDQERGFDLSKAPLMRLTLIRLAEDTYQITWSYHHLLLDGWSLSLVFKEVHSLYEALCQNQDLHLKPPRPYRDYITWLQQQDLSQAETFWRQSLQGIQSPTSIKVTQFSDNFDNQQEDYTNQQIQLSKSTTSALKSLAQQHELTLNTLAQGAWALLLSYYSGENDVIFGTTSTGRPVDIEGVESMVGLFISTLPVRVRIYPQDTVLAWLKKLQVQQIEARQYEYSPLVQIQEWSEFPRNVPLFESLVIFENTPVDKSLQEKDSSVQLLDVGIFEKTNYPLTVGISPGSELSLEILYERSRFQDATIKRMLEHFRVLLEGIAANGEQKLANLSILTEQERQQLLIDWNSTQAEYFKEQCIHKLFEAQVEATPDAIAVVFEDKQLSYRELNSRANQLAHHLRSLGVKPEVLIGICVEKSLELIVAVLGVLKAGGAYVPLDPTYSQERLDFVLEDTQAFILLTQQQLIEMLPAQKAKIVCLDRDWEQIAQETEDNLLNEVTPANLAYVIYTSGSTGKPKGVMVEHSSLTNAYLAWEEAYQLRSEAKCHLQMASFSFDVFVGDLVRSLCSGGKLVLCPRELLLEADQLYQLMRQTHVDCAEFVPAVLRNLMQYLEENGQSLDFMHLLICGSDSWYGGEYNKFQQFCGKATRLINSFGLTEATIDSSYFEATAVNLSVEQLVPIGRPFANTQLYILNPCLQPVPVGVPGELYIGGAGVARGYWNQPELTAEKFIPNPFSAESGDYLYKTGDQAYWLLDGNIELLGRIDHQVKIRGFRIEPGEIEAVIQQNSAVQEVVVQATEGKPGNKQLVAYIVPHPQVEITVRQKSEEKLASHVTPQLRAFLKEKLPEYMRPSHFILLDALPLLPNGKVDRKKLPAADTTRPELEATFVPPRTLTEELLVGIWSNVLGLDQVGIYDNFFDLGGHSLLAIRLISQLRNTFQVELSLRSLFEFPTVAGLSDRIEEARQAKQGLPIVPLVPISRDQELQLSFSQEHIWFLEKQLTPEHYFYNIPSIGHFKTDLNLGALEQSLNVILQRHETLRTNFTVVDGQPILSIAPASALTLSVLDLRDLPKHEREAKAMEITREDVWRPFNLANEPLLRATLLQLDESEYVLVITIHQNAFDAWSRNVLWREVGTLYQAFSTGKPSPLAELPIQYADFVHWQKQSLSPEVLETQLSYWKQRLAAPLPILNLPTDYPRPPVKTFQGASQLVVFSKNLTKALRELSQQEEVSMFITNLAAYQTLLYSYTGQEDILVGTSADNRTRRELENLIGCFNNYLVLRTDLSGNPSFRELLGRVRQTSMEVYDYLDMPFSRLVSTLQPESDLSRTPLVQAMLVYKQFLDLPTMESLEDLDFTILPFNYDYGTARCDLAVSLMDVGEQITGILEYSTDLFNADTISRMLGNFQDLLDKIVADPDQRLSELRLVIKADLSEKASLPG